MTGLEALHCYFITNNLIGNKVKQATKRFTYKALLLLCSYGVVSTFFAVFPTTSQYEALSFAWQVTILGLAVIIQMIILFIVTTNVVRNKNSSTTFDEIVLLFFIYFLLNLVLTSIIIIPSVIALNFLLNYFLRIIFVCVSSFILTILFLTILDKVDLNKLFVFIVHRVAIKIAFFAISLISLLAFFFSLLSLDLTAFLDIIQMIASLGLMVLILIIGFVHTLRAAHQYEVVVPERYHDMKKILTLLNLRAEDAQTVDELKGMIEATIELMGIKIEKPELQKSEDEPKDFEAFIRCAINSLKLNHKSSVEINTTIQHFEPHKNVSAMNVSYMLGTLLENAIETGTKHPILVDILSTEHVLFIKVANEVESKTPQELYSMLSKGYSTKEKVGRGFGLSKLKSLVESHQGNIIITQEMNPTAQANYIVFTLNF